MEDGRRKAQKCNSTVQQSEAKTKPNSLSQNNANANDGEVPMECFPPSKLLAGAATNTTGANMYFIYTVSIDFPVPNNKDKFNMHQAFTRLMQELIRADRELIVVATKVEDTWTTTQDLHTDNAFNKAFNVKQET
eukprot:3592342-Ditylum_brightwellii.AAC.1